MELQQLRYVVAVAETSSFTRAAERCLVVQSALSHQVARLERELGARLFERTSRRVRLTHAGEAFLPAARQCLDAAERAAAEVASAVGEIRGRLAVGVIPTVAAVDVPAALHSFHQRCPQVRIDLRVGPSEQLVEQVKDGVLELAFLGLPVTARPRGVESRPLAQDRLVAVVAPDHRLAGESEIELARLADEAFVDLPAGTAGRAQSDQAFAAAGVHREVAFEVTTVDLMMIRLVRQGLCVALLPSNYAPDLTGVVTIPVRDAPERIEHLVWTRATLSPAATAFLTALDIAVDGATRGQPTTPGWPAAPRWDGEGRPA
ncbi:DNA-binding transcriptional LysR family regulator [Actinoalloteichus hoggarensis]|uniref:HTH-type transcriptional regulator GltC n=1 Tax=Actinoalloteichus hoggarensis TaxID=1470176 RepID=A0A221W3P7_9PSEU|nr:LysR family transcriptional regulator [Actinoalloteichus hoggarensis]ASO20490.1 HTH-type transcriptional regulator GltC [Actinoalloteichus hoggarensis]MBB5923530.1 DNA-binding transcriptional LysR family regulator [Actinoalloteichus hoggarensis]